MQNSTRGSQRSFSLEALSCQISAVRETRVRGRWFTPPGVSQTTWLEVIASTKRAMEEAASFSLSTRDKSFTTKCVVSSKLFFAARRALPLRTIACRFARLCESFFLKKKHRTRQSRFVPASSFSRRLEPSLCRSRSTSPCSTDSSSRSRRPGPSCGLALSALPGHEAQRSPFRIVGQFWFHRLGDATS